MYENLLNQNFTLGLCAFLQGDATLVFFMCINFSVSGFFFSYHKEFYIRKFILQLITCICFRCVLYISYDYIHITDKINL